MTLHLERSSSPAEQTRTLQHYLEVVDDYIKDNLHSDLLHTAKFRDSFMEACAEQFLRLRHLLDATQPTPQALETQYYRLASTLELQMNRLAEGKPDHFGYPEPVPSLEEVGSGTLHVHALERSNQRAATPVPAWMLEHVSHIIGLRDRLTAVTAVLDEHLYGVELLDHKFTAVLGAPNNNPTVRRELTLLTGELVIRAATALAANPTDLYSRRDEVHSAYQAQAEGWKQFPPLAEKYQQLAEHTDQLIQLVINTKA